MVNDKECFRVVELNDGTFCIQRYTGSWLGVNGNYNHIDDSWQNVDCYLDPDENYRFLEKEKAVKIIEDYKLKKCENQIKSIVFQDSF